MAEPRQRQSRARKVLRVIPSTEQDRKDVVETLKDLLAQARRGEISWVAIYLERSAGNNWGYFRAGHVDPTAAIGALRVIEHELLHSNLGSGSEPNSGPSPVAYHGRGHRTGRAAEGALA